MVQICQYEFLVEDMFTNKLRDEIVKLLKISPDDLMKKKFNDGQCFVLYKANENNYILFSAHVSSIVWVAIIRCDIIYENEIQKILFAICEEMEEEACYDDIDFRKYIVNVFKEEETELKFLEEKYKVSSMFGIFVDEKDYI